MPGLNIFTSNKLEILAAQLAQHLNVPASELLRPDMIVIQSVGMERWISQELAGHNGICANIEFPFPNSFLDQIANQILPADHAPSPLDPDILLFEILKLLPECTRRRGFERLGSYLRDDPTRLKELQIAGKLADLYDQYQVFRPEMIFRWERGQRPEFAEDYWQVDLWQQLLSVRPTLDRSSRQRNLIEKLETAPELFSDLPQRIFIFGISYLPPFHVEAFAALSQVVETNFYLLNPCREYWGDILSQKQIQRIRRNYSHSADTASELHLEEGNRLLASMGAHGKDFHTAISNFELQMHEDYADPGCINLLSCIQSDILNLRDRGPHYLCEEDHTNQQVVSSPEPVLAISPSDASIQIHSCHSPMREIEILHDSLLAMFDADRHLLPKDIVVMTPDIETYTPIIQAVFDAQTEERHYIPFNLADRGIRGQGRLIDDFFSFLDFKGTRFSVARVLRLLEANGVRRKFDIQAGDIDIIERWINDTQIRWGIDAEHRRGLGLPALSENTWHTGIKRLLLGYAMPGNNERMFDGVVPYDAVEGKETDSFGKFLDFSETVFRYGRDLSVPKTLQSWSAFLKALLDDVFLADEASQRESQNLRSILNDLEQRQTDVGLTDQLEIEPIRFYLEQRVEKLRFGTGFMTGGVTFCAMLPMRSIPFKVVCLVGMNSDVFPRDSQPLSFDLAARQPKPGDRSRRNDDKYIFLESLISARNTLYISYVGQSVQDNTCLPPSVVISDLLDTIEKGFELRGENIRSHVLRFHHLQAFAPEYFKNSERLFSYSTDNCDAAAIVGRHQEQKPLVTRAMPLSESEKAAWRDIDIEYLCRFFSHPARFLLQNRLGIYLHQFAAFTEKREDFDLSSLDQFVVGNKMLAFRLGGYDLNDRQPALMGMGQFPHGNVGKFRYAEIRNEVEQFAGKVETFKKNRAAGPLDTWFDIGDLKLRVRLPEIHDGGLIHSRYAKQRAQDLIRMWIYHLALCDTAGSDELKISVMLFKDANWHFQPVVQPKAYLTELITLFLSGLEKPLHLFPASSLEFVRQQHKGKSEEQALALARLKWTGNEFFKGESDDPYFDTCFKMSDPLNESFVKVSRAVFEPLLEHGEQMQNDTHSFD